MAGSLPVRYLAAMEMSEPSCGCACHRMVHAGGIVCHACGTTTPPGVEPELRCFPVAGRGIWLVPCYRPGHNPADNPFSEVQFAGQR